MIIFFNFFNFSLLLIFYRLENFEFKPSMVSSSPAYNSQNDLGLDSEYHDTSNSILEWETRMLLNEN